VENLRRYGLIALVAATAMTAITTFQTQMQYVVRGEDMDFAPMLGWNAIIWYVWGVLAPFVIVFCQRHPLEWRGWKWRAFALQAAAALVFIVLHAAIVAAAMQVEAEWFGMPAAFPARVVRLLTTQAHWGVMCYLATAACANAGIYFRRARDESLAREALRTQAATAQLSALQRQMQPHFLFNALNALVAMLEENSKAQHFTVRLADMLRMLLHHGERATATLGEELVLVKAYLAVERVRLGARLRSRIDVADALLDRRLPSFLLQPLVENAIRHGIARSLDGGEIALRAWRDGGEIRIEIENTGAQPPSATDAGMRMTLPNCRDRLALLYDEAARFEAGFVGQGHYRVVIVVPDRAPVLGRAA